MTRPAFFLLITSPGFKGKFTVGLRVAVAVEVGVEVREAVGDDGRVLVGEGSCIPGRGSLVFVGEGSFMDGGGSELNSGDAGATPPHDASRRNNSRERVYRSSEIRKSMITSLVRACRDEYYRPISQ